MALTTSDRIAATGVAVTAAGVMAAWLALPMFNHPRHGSADEAAAPKPTAVRRSATLNSRDAAVTSVTFGTLTFDFESCRLAGENVTCEATITNAEPRDLYIRARCGVPGSTTKIIDALGREHFVEHCAIGSDRVSVHASKILAPFVKYQLFATFRGFDSARQPLRLVEFDVFDRDNRQLTVRFRNVPLSAP